MNVLCIKNLIFLLYIKYQNVRIFYYSYYYYYFFFKKKKGRLLGMNEPLLGGLWDGLGVSLIWGMVQAIPCVVTCDLIRL
jgi:hypothetical protein